MKIAHRKQTLDTNGLIRNRKKIEKNKYILLPRTQINIKQTLPERKTLCYVLIIHNEECLMVTPLGDSRWAPVNDGLGVRARVI